MKLLHNARLQSVHSYLCVSVYLSYRCVINFLPNPDGSEDVNSAKSGSGQILKLKSGASLAYTHIKSTVKSVMTAILQISRLSVPAKEFLKLANIW